MRQMKLIGLLIVVLLAANLVVRSTSGDGKVDPGPPAPVVVSMTSHKVSDVGCCETYHFYRVWSDGFTEWNARGINWDNGTASWRGWESIDDDTGPW